MDMSSTWKQGAFTQLNYYTGEEVTIPLDPTLTRSGKRHKNILTNMDKLKRTYEAL